MNIGDASERTGLPAKTIRYYEDIQLVKPARHGNGYRDYSEADVHRLRFLQRARGLGFSVEECRQLLSLYSDRDRASADVKAIALEHVTELDKRIVELTEMRDTLADLARSCSGDERADCPILRGLETAEHGDCCAPTGKQTR